MASQLLIVGSVDGHAEMQLFAGRGAIGIVVDVALAHRLVFLVVEDDDDDRQLVPLGGAERLDDGVVKERAVADEQRHRPLGCRELDAERGADPLAEATRAAKEALRPGLREVLADEGRMGDRLVHVDRVGGHHLCERAQERERIDGASVLRLLPRGTQLGDVVLVLAGPALPPRVHRGGIDLR